MWLPLRSADDVNRRIALGYQFNALAMDTSFLVNTAKAEWAKLVDIAKA